MTDSWYEAFCRRQHVPLLDHDLDENQPRPRCVYFSDVSVSPLFLSSLASKAPSEPHRRMFHLRVSFYDEVTKTFFGNTWSSQGRDVNAESHRDGIRFDEGFVFHTRASDSSLLAVVELVQTWVPTRDAVSATTAEGQAPRQQTWPAITVGWTVLPVFAGEQQALAALEDRHKQADVAAVGLQAGTPVALVCLQGPYVHNLPAPQDGSPTLTWQLLSLPDAHPVISMLPEHFALGSAGPFPGLLGAPASTVSGGRVEPEWPLALEPRDPEVLFLHGVTIFGDATLASVEERLCFVMSQRLPLPQRKLYKTRIQQRHLRVGVHNTMRFLAEEDVLHLKNASTSSTTSEDGGLLLESDSYLKLGGFVADSNVALCLALEYDFELVPIHGTTEETQAKEKRSVASRIRSSLRIRRNKDAGSDSQSKRRRAASRRQQKHIVKSVIAWTVIQPNLSAADVSRPATQLHSHPAQQLTEYVFAADLRYRAEPNPVASVPLLGLLGDGLGPLCWPSQQGGEETGAPQLRLSLKVTPARLASETVLREHFRRTDAASVLASKRRQRGVVPEEHVDSATPAVRPDMEHRTVVTDADKGVDQTDQAALDAQAVEEVTPSAATAAPPGTVTGLALGEHLSLTDQQALAREWSRLPRSVRAELFQARLEDLVSPSHATQPDSDHVLSRPGPIQVRLQAVAINLFGDEETPALSGLVQRRVYTTRDVVMTCKVFRSRTRRSQPLHIGVNDVSLSASPEVGASGTAGALCTYANLAKYRHAAHRAKQAAHQQEHAPQCYFEAGYTLDFDLTLCSAEDAHRFRNYLRKTHIEMNIYDGSSRFVIGRAKLSLKALLSRKRGPASPVLVEADIQKENRVASTSADPTEVTASASVSAGVIFLRAAVQRDLRRATLQGQVHKRPSQTLLEQAFATAPRGGLGTAAALASNMMQARDAMVAPLVSEPKTRQPREAALRSLLDRALTRKETLVVPYGSTGFFEHPIRNDSDTDLVVLIESVNPGLSLVTDFKEWRALGDVYGSKASMIEPQMFHPHGKGHILLLRPFEECMVPFKYVCAGETHADCISDLLVDRESANSLKEPAPREAKVVFRRDDGSLLAQLSLTIQPLPPSLDHELEYHATEHSSFKHLIQIKSSSSRSSSSKHLYLSCTDPDVHCTAVTHQLLDGACQNVHLRCDMEAAPHTRRFVIFGYSSPYQIQPTMAVLVAVSAVKTLHLDCCVGEVTQRVIGFRCPDEAFHEVGVYCSEPRLLQAMPSKPFTVQPRAVVELGLYATPSEPGIRQCLVHVVDTASRVVVQRLLVSLQSRLPVPTHVYELAVPCEKGTAKKISYVNPYSADKTFVLRTNRPDLLALLPEEIEVGGSQTVFITFKLLPYVLAGQQDVFVFINNLQNRTEDAFLLRVTYQADDA